MSQATGIVLSLATAIFFSGLFQPQAIGQQNAAPGKSAVVQVVRQTDGFMLTRNGQPYLIRGVGGTSNLALLSAIGGNSVRTWGTDGIERLLNECHGLGLTVTVGIWLGHERHGFNYNDAEQVAAQYESARETIERYKEHPAVLMWGLGNEMEGYEDGQNAAIWSAINNIASLAKKLDPNHPTMTVIAEVGGNRVKNIHRLCPDIDVVGINSYAGLPTLPERYRAAGGTKPYVVTEFGPPGAWEVEKNEWGVAPEPSSSAKADSYRLGYEQGVSGAKGQCLGSYAFLWGQKQEATATWFGMLLPDGSRLAAVDTMQELWSGAKPTNRCPEITELLISGAAKVKPQETVAARLLARDPENDSLKVSWVLQAEPLDYGVGGDGEQAPPTFPDAIIQSNLESATVRMPIGGGGYRLFAYVRDDHGGAAVANVPLYVDAPIIVPDAPPAQLPLAIYDESTTAKAAYVPTGWMGNTDALKLDPKSTENVHAGQTCLQVDYRDSDGWAGVVWQSPPDDWGDRPGGWNLTGAKTLTFWARGANGGETVSFEFGLLGADKRFADSGRGKLGPIALGRQWERHTIDLAGQDLSRIKTGFAFVVAGQGKPIRFFLDDIQFGK